MKRLILIISASLLALASAAQGEKVTTPNYDLAERFSAKHVNNMVFSTQIRPQWFRDSDRFWYSWKTSDGTKYWIVDPAAGKKTEIFDMDKLAMQLTEIVKDPFDAKHIPFDKLRLKDDKYFTFDIKSTADTKDKKDSTKTVKKVFHFKYDIAAGKLEEVEEYKNPYPRFASVSPDGQVGVYVKNHNLYCMDTLNMRKAAENPKDTTIVERQLTFDGTRDHSWNGNNYTGDMVKDSTERRNVYIAWSPDSRHFATTRWDMSKVQEMWVINSTKGKRPELETYKYQMPGEEGPEGDLVIFDIQSGEYKKIKTHVFKNQDLGIETSRPEPADLHKEWYSRKWLGDEKGFYLMRTSRDLKRHDLCYVPVDGDSTRTIITERMNTYIESRDHILLEGGRKILHWSERNGWANIYLYNSDGSLIRNLTEGPFHVENVLAVNEKSGYMIVAACGVNKNENPYQMHTYKVSLSGGPMVQMDMEDMDVLSDASHDGKYFVANYSRVDAKPAVALFDAQKGNKIMELEEADFRLLFEAGYKFPERFKVKAADGITDLYGAMYKPFDFDSTKVYPICDYVYPGPQVEANNISWSKGFTRTDRLAQVGFIVITVGNRGGHPNRSKWYHNYGYGNLRDYGLEDQKYAIQQLAARHPFIDINRVGIHGHSGGGFMSTAAILKYPDFFKVAVSCAGNHDNSIYNRWWSETHHGVKEKVVKGDTTFVYSIKTNQELAKNLKGHLLLVHGDMDNNVHPAGTTRVIDALIRANKRFDMLFLPGQRHGFGDMNEYFFWRMADYYSEWLMGAGRPGEVDIKELNND